jgi:hypothetical protein
MSTMIAARSVPRTNGVSLLENGDRMKQPEFHRRYAAYPDHVKFELIGGIVYMASPARYPHGTYSQELSLVTMKPWGSQHYFQSFLPSFAFTATERG